MKKLVVIFALMMISAFTFAGSNQYRVDDKAVDALFAQSQEISMVSLVNNVDEGLMNLASPTQVKGGSDAIVAFALCWFVGWLGVHRMYLGSTIGVYIGYIITGGGCGIIVTIDWIMLLIGVIQGGDVSKYVDNPKFFMWAN